ncbi:MAG: glutamate-5-semialdehyde dehydrogenase [Armatimonadetes bacterium]|nr:glutamate-5-semialdehyde dehydrogenase [Armatimonadota bacterium]
MSDSLDTARAQVRDLGLAAKAAARSLAQASTGTKNAALAAMADGLAAARDTLLAANQLDLDAAAGNGVTGAMLNRLALNDKRLAGMVQGLRDLIALPDPVGGVVDGWRRPNGLDIRRVRVPLGVVGIIYESRPNVTADAAGLCLKSGNACILRGGKEAINSNRAIREVLAAGCVSAGLPAEAIQLVTNITRDSALALMQAEGLIDCLIPRGGRGLIANLKDNAKVPYIIDGDGICHTFVNDDADQNMASAVVLNAKCSYPAVCNAMETLLVHADLADTFLPRVAAELQAAGVELRGCPVTCAKVSGIKPATDEDWDTEYGDLILSVKVVADLDDAMDHIAAHGSGHSEAIVTSSYAAGRRFTHEVDAAAVYINASTRFTDGGEFGFGAEIGISTQKLHARGPLGLIELTTAKYIVEGDGQVR